LSTPQPHAAVSFEIGGNFKPDENSVLIVAVPDLTQNQTLTVTNPDFVRYVVIVIINKYKNDFYLYGRRQGNGCEIQFRGLL
jgi:alpha-D-ribose 1-methylphosphonate 5-triphosphate synthase subunit PhnH